MEGKESVDMIWIYHDCLRWTADKRAHHQALHQKASQIPMKRKKENGEGRDLKRLGSSPFVYVLVL